MTDVLYGELSCLTVGAAMEVHRILGPGFLEPVYEEALAYELTPGHVSSERQVSLHVKYKEVFAGDYRADFLIDKKIILEIKAGSAFIEGHDAQAIHYLAATGLRLAILLNFGTNRLQMRRIIR